MTMLEVGRGSDRFRLTGRAAAIVAKIITKAERINAATRGSLEFHFDEHDLKTSFHEHESDKARES